jgi:hypothetical protein
MKDQKALWIIVVCIAFISSPVLAQPPKLPVTPGATFGASLSKEGAIPVAELPGMLKAKETAHVTVIGKVMDVCPKKGCWMSIEMPGNEPVFVMMKDYGFFVPLELIGKKVVIDGQASVVTTSVAELRHYAEDAKKSKEEIEAITAPKKEIRLTANGIAVLE